MKPFLVGLRNQLLQAVAQFAPGSRSVRVWLHRRRGVRLGSDVFIGTAVIIETARPSWVWIGDRVSLSVRSVVLAHNRGDLPQYEVSADGARTLVPTVRIEEDIYVGAGAIILAGVTIGAGSVVAAGSVVSRSVAPRTVVRGNPARPVARADAPLTSSYSDFVKNIRPLRRSHRK